MSLVRIDDLHKRYGDTVAVDAISLTVEEGEVLGIIGPNGSGKTTTVKCLAGLRRPDGGTVRVAGLDPVADRDQVRQLVGIQLQEARLPDKLRVGEAIELYASFYPDPADTEQLLTDLGLADRRTAAFDELSGGLQQRLSIALALVGRPRLAVLDELTTGLDPHARRAIWQLIETVRDAGVSVVLVSHVMEEVERLCDRVAVIDHGRIVALGSPEALVTEFVGEQRLRFRPGDGFDPSRLRDLAGITALHREGRWVHVSGSGDLALVVTRALADQGLEAADLRTETPSLDDAFLTLTGRHVTTETVAPAT